ncbi:unnamed protein product [Adineta steineri]|uniref:Uncharacterized protein n=2 Tax=Adineta steineri TaxID=433720 RepID=A0A814VY70_9BILA|nr:unnamed protein product [Adineta steineri]
MQGGPNNPGANMSERITDDWIERNVPGGLNSSLGQQLDNMMGGNPNPTPGQSYGSGGPRFGGANNMGGGFSGQPGGGFQRPPGGGFPGQVGGGFPGQAGGGYPGQVGGGYPRPPGGQFSGGFSGEHYDHHHHHDDHHHHHHHHDHDHHHH